jgi:hypothetical protein
MMMVHNIALHIKLFIMYSGCQQVPSIHTWVSWDPSTVEYDIYQLIYFVFQMLCMPNLSL